MGTVILRAAEEGVDEGGDEHDEGHERKQQLGAVREVAQEEGVGKEGAAPEAQHADVEQELQGVVRAVADEERQHGGHEHDEERDEGLGGEIEGVPEEGRGGMVGSVAGGEADVADQRARGEGSA